MGKSERSDSMAKKTTGAKKINPFACLTPADMKKYSGQVIAVDMSGSGVLEVAQTAELLQGLMERRHPTTKYGRLAIP